MQHSWPGNVRELRNLAERYVLLGPAALDETDPSSAANVAGRQTLSEMMDGLERSAIISALNACQGSIKDTMVQLGIARKTLYDKMRKHGLDKAQFKD
jgi:two-component system C4-dicarboxylate transport response regulator DctD